MRALYLIAVLALPVLIACGAQAASSPRSLVDDPESTPGIPGTTASAITFAPANQEGLNNQAHVYGTGADPGIITLGPREGGQPGWIAYPGKNSMEFELPHGTPVLAPLNMVLTGFNNRNANYRIGSEGERFEPFDDLEICFEAVDENWPGVIVCTYHLSTSPLLQGQDVDPACTKVDEWPGSKRQAAGHLWFENEDYSISENSYSLACRAMIGRQVDRGQVIGFAGSVGDHSMAPFRFKVPDETENSTVKKGNRNLHWVQPGSFFYWKCYSPERDFSEGVLAYPFECDGYNLPPEQQNPGFKYRDVQ